MKVWWGKNKRSDNHTVYIFKLFVSLQLLPFDFFSSIATITEVSDNLVEYSVIITKGNDVQNYKNETHVVIKQIYALGTKADPECTVSAEIHDNNTEKFLFNGTFSV